VALPPDALFGRSFRVTVADKQFGSVDAERPLSIVFNVQRDKSLTPNNASVLLYNLSADTRAELEELTGGFGQGSQARKPTKLTSTARRHGGNGTHHKTTRGVAQAPADADGVVVRIEAGYGDRLGQIFLGVLRKASSWRRGTEWVTEISGGDSEHSITTAKISKSYKTGTLVTTVVRDLVGTLGVGVGGLDGTLNALAVTGLLTGGATLQKALTLHGDSATNLEQLMRSCGFEWSVQDGHFYAGPAGQPTVPGAGPLLTPETGLLDTPQIDKNGRCVGKALLNPDLLPGRVFRVESSRVSGNFVCEKTQHSGSTAPNGEWVVEFVGSPPAKGSKAAILAEALGDTGFTTSPQP
jgi:hypothetical protein